MGREWDVRELSELELLELELFVGSGSGRREVWLPWWGPERPSDGLIVATGRRGLSLIFPARAVVSVVHLLTGHPWSDLLDEPALSDLDPEGRCGCGCGFVAGRGWPRLPARGA